VRTYRKYNHWPNPFRNIVQQLDVLACEDTFQARIKMYSSQFGNWFYSSFVPSPVELTRKFATGSYKCGFYLPIRLRSPLDIVWRDGRTSAMLAEVLRPVVTGLFYMWAFDTAFEAIHTWSTIKYAMEMCELDKYECLIRDGHSPMPQGTHEGNSAFAQVIYDPNNWAIPNDGSIAPGPNQSASAFGCGLFVANGKTIDDLRVELRNNNVVIATESIGHVGPGEIVAWSVGGAGFIVNGTLACVYVGTVSGAGIIQPEYLMTRFTVRATPIDIPNDGPGYQPDPSRGPFSRCDQVTRFYDSM